jgi:hypothetical protein
MGRMQVERCRLYCKAPLNILIGTGAGASLTLIRDILGTEGVWGMLLYARVSLAQVAPGFMAFLGAKVLVRVCLGKSKCRYAT